MSHSATVAYSPVPAGRLTTLLGLLVVLGPFTIDLYLPAFPQMESGLGASPFAVQLTLSGATVGLALGQMVVGPWSDSVGRRLPLLVGTGAHILASVAIAAAHSVELIIALRVIQGAGAAASSVVATAMIRDIAEGRALLKGLARIALFGGVAPIVAPFLGAQLMYLINWRGIFVVVAAYGVAVLLLALLTIPETLPRERRLGTRGKDHVLRRYTALLRNRTLVGVAIIGGMMVSSVFAYLSTSSFMFQQSFGLGPQEYGLISAVNGAMFVVGTQVAAVAAGRWGASHVLVVNLATMLLLTVMLAGADWVGLELAGIVVLMAVFMLFAGSCGPCLSALGLAKHGDRAGTAAAFLGAANYGLAGIASPVVGLLGVQAIAPLGLVMLTAMLLANIALWWAVLRPERGSRHQ